MPVCNYVGVKISPDEYTELWASEKLPKFLD